MESARSPDTCSRRSAGLPFRSFSTILIPRWRRWHAPKKIFWRRSLMNVRKITGAVLVVGLAGGLHWGFRGLAAGLPQLFPRLALEKRVAMLPPVTADDEWPTALPAAEDDPPPPEGAIPLKKAGEDLLASIEDSASTPGKKGDGAG